MDSRPDGNAFHVLHVECAEQKTYLEHTITVDGGIS